MQTNDGEYFPQFKPAAFNGEPRTPACATKPAAPTFFRKDLLEMFFISLFYAVIQVGIVSIAFEIRESQSTNRRVEGLKLENPEISLSLNMNL